MSESRKFPPDFRRIRLELAREPNHPAGDQAFGYTIVAPLDRESRLNATQWKENKELCRVVRFRPEGVQEVGHLVHAAGGAWKFQYENAQDESEESGYRLGTEHFVVGEYVSIKSDEGMHTYRVVTVEPV